MLPIDAQREFVFIFKTRALPLLTELEENERFVKGDILRKMMDGQKFNDNSRHSLHLIAHQKRFWKSMLALDAVAAKQHLEAYMMASQTHLDGLIFGEIATDFVAVIGSDDESLSVHTGDDGKAVAYGDAIKETVDSMQMGLHILQKLRKKCPAAV